MKHLITCFIFFLSITSVRAQSGLEFYAGAIAAFNHERQKLWNSELHEDLTRGIELQATYGYRPEESSFEGIGRLGLRKLYFSGRTDPSPYAGATTKLNIALGVRYHLDPLWSAGLLIHMENNRDLEDFRTQTSDNFRYSGSVQLVYRFYKWMGVQLAYSRAFYPLEDHYLFSNPVHQFSLGLNCKLF